jgi:hypothetical protein
MNETICLELTKSHRPTEGNPSYLRKSASICGSAFLLGLLRVHSCPFAVPSFLFLFRKFPCRYLR